MGVLFSPGLVVLLGNIPMHPLAFPCHPGTVWSLATSDML